MNRQWSQDNPFDEIDEHNLPTEPMGPIIISPPSSSISGDERIPMPQPHERPFPQQQVRDVPPFGIAQRPPETSVYPYLPPAPAIDKGGRPAGGASPGCPTSSAQATEPKRSAFPAYVGLFFVGVQLLLLVSFVLKVFGLPGTILWVSIIYHLSTIFVLPVRLLLQNITPSISFDWIAVYTLLAILLYGMLSRILVRFLKALLHSR